MGRKTKQPSSSSFWYSRSRRCSSAPTTPRPEPAETEAPPVGCMSMVHYLIFAPGAGCVGRPPTSTSSSSAIVTLQDGHGHRRRRGDDDKQMSGFEAPRNSLDDLDADDPNDSFQIGVQIAPVFDALAVAGRTTTSSARRPSSKKPATAPSSEAETPRTPSLVARLMGIDGLPDSSPEHKKQPQPAGRRSGKENDISSCCGSSPPPAPSKGEKEKKKRVIPESMNRREPLRSLSCNMSVGGGGEVAARRSLPETPARASWDGPRLSLQALRESVLDRAAHYMSMPSSPTAGACSGERNKTKKKDPACSRRRSRSRDEEKTAKEHAREILRHAKETVASRKEKSAAAGSNTSASSSPAPEKKRQSCFNDKENVMTTMDDAKLRAKPTTAAAPAKPRAEHRHHSGPRVALAPMRQQQQPPSSPPTPPPPQRAKPSRPPPPPPPLDPPPTRARKPDGCERFATRVKKPATAAAAAAAAPSTTTTTECRSASAAGGARVSPPSQPLEEDPEYRYLRAVLERGGFMRPSPPPPPRRHAAGRGHHWHSVAAAALPVDPIVFHLLELELELPADDEARQLGPLRHRWNRKLLFHLAQELLADLLPSTSTTSTGLPLLAKVWRRARSFPAADCKVVGDIDALVAADLRSCASASVRRRRHPAVEEDAGDVAAEVADGVLDALVAECVAESAVSLSCAAAARPSRAAAR